MRSLILAALLALPVASYALPVNEEIHYFELKRCSVTVMVLIVTQSQAIPITDMDALSRTQRSQAEIAKRFAIEQGNAYKVEMPERGKCHQI